MIATSTDSCRPSLLGAEEIEDNGKGDFFMRSAPKSGDQRWWLQATGEGDKERLIPATAELMVELMQYRRSLELSDLPQAHISKTDVDTMFKVSADQPST